MPTLETLRVETDHSQNEDEATPVSLSHIFKEGMQMAQIWSAQDRLDHEKSVREILDQMIDARRSLERFHTQTDAIWERFSTLVLERILFDQLREFIDQLDADLQALDQSLTETDCHIDRLRARVQERRRVLGEKKAIVEPLAHRTSTQSHIGMMLSRVEGLESSLLGEKREGAPDAGELYDKYPATAPGDLLYLRVRLITTRIAIIASNRSKHLSDLDAGLAMLLPEIERFKTDMATLTTRLDCIKDLCRYWLAYLDITQSAKSSEG